MKKLLTLLLLLFLNAALYAGDAKKDEDIDYVALATILIKDGHYSRANEALSHIDVKSEDTDLAQYYTLEGIVKMKLRLYKESNENFYKAIKNGQKEKSIYLYIAQNYFKLKEYDKVIEALNEVPELVKKKPTLMALKAEAYYRLKKYNDALNELAELLKLHPKYYDAYRQRFVYFMSLKLYQSALDDANVYLKHAKANEKVTISFIYALREAKELKKAILLAEDAHLKYPKNATITVLLANLYIDKDMLKSAADLFNDASMIDYKYTKDAAEMYRRAKDFVEALYKNSQIVDPKEKYRQRIAIYLEFGAYEKIAAMKDALERNGLLKDQNILYALAYAYYKNGEYDLAEKYLKKITRSDLYKKSIELRKNMAKCKNNHWECSL